MIVAYARTLQLARRILLAHREYTYTTHNRYSARFARCVNTIMIHIYKIINYSLEKRDNRESIHIHI